MEQVVFVNCAFAAQGDRGQWTVGLRPMALKMSPLPGLKSNTFSAHSGRQLVDRVATYVSWHRGAKSLVLSPGRGDILNAVTASPQLQATVGTAAISKAISL